MGILDRIKRKLHREKPTDFEEQHPRRCGNCVQHRTHGIYDAAPVCGNVMSDLWRQHAPASSVCPWHEYDPERLRHWAKERKMAASAGASTSRGDARSRNDTDRGTSDSTTPSKRRRASR